jgi:bifunctional non-homologous end joining protein LigD
VIWYESAVPGGIEPSNLDKVFWADSGLTKGDLLAYFDAVSPFLLREIRDRPLTVKRYPDGIEGFSFYQKNTPTYAPDWVRTVKLPAESARRDVNYTLCNSKRTLMWLANQAAIELHAWPVRADRLDRPDQLIFDLDPPEDRFDMAVDTALATAEALRRVGLHAAAKTSGAKGVHVYAPLRRTHSTEGVRSFASRIALSVQERVPEIATVEFRRAQRGGRVLVDVARNSPGQHAAVAYAPRARPGAPVSFPVAWRDLPHVSPQEFTIQTVPTLLAQHGDRWAELLGPPQRLPRD